MVDPSLNVGGGSGGGSIWAQSRTGCARAIGMRLLTVVGALLGLAAGHGGGVAWTNQCWKDGKMAACGPGNDQCSAPWDAHLRPRYHIHDRTCPINDPNFPFYDPVHGLYHLFYQDRLSIPYRMGRGVGPVIGHAVSRDLVHWAHLDVAIWNDQWYDERAVYTGSTTLLDDGSPVLTYPGLCLVGRMGCITGTTLNHAVPANRSDPLLTNWTKPAYNPILNNTSDDPSTAWSTPSGEWRMVANSPALGQNDTSRAPIFATSGDAFTGPWRLVGDSPLPTGECQSLFPLPPLTVPDNSDSLQQQMPTHVHKRGSPDPNHRTPVDLMSVGTWTDGQGPQEVGRWEPTPGHPFEERVIDQGIAYASKDFLDTSTSTHSAPRRVLWAWARTSPTDSAPGGAQTIPRVMTYHPTLKQLVFSALPELSSLRQQPALAVLGLTGLSPHQRVEVGPLPEGAGNCSDVTVEFARPTSATNLTVSVMSGDVQISLLYVPGPAGHHMGQDMDRVAGRRHSVEAAAAEQVQNVTVGIGCVGCNGTAGWISDTLQMLPTDTSISVQVFTDRTLVEVYFMNGRVAITAPMPSGNLTRGAVAVGSTGPATVISASVYGMQSVWITPEELLATPRLAKSEAGTGGRDEE